MQVSRSRHYRGFAQKPQHGPYVSAQSAKSFYSVEFRTLLRVTPCRAFTYFPRLALNPARSQPRKAPNAIVLPEVLQIASGDLVSNDVPDDDHAN